MKLFFKQLLCLSLVIAWMSSTNAIAAEHEIRINSDPASATLTLNGHELGTTPLVIKDIDLGKHLLCLKKDGYFPYEKIIEITKQSSPEMTIELEKMFGLVLFQTNPSGAEITADRIYKGKTPISVTDLPCGNHMISFSLEGYDSKETVLELNDRVPKLCQMDLRSNHAIVEVKSDPSGAAITIDGINKGETPCLIDDIMLGTHLIKIAKDGFKAYQDNFKLVETGTFPIAVKLQQELASIEVTSNPVEARVTINNEFKGKTPLQIAALPDGKYRIVVDKISYETIVRDIQIKNAKDAKLDITLEKATGTLSMNINPVGAKVIIDSEIKGVSTEDPYNQELPPGSYQVEISKSGYKPQIFRTDIQLRKRVSLELALKRIWKKDTLVRLKDERVKDGMLLEKRADGGVRLEVAPTIIEEFSVNEIVSVETKESHE